MRRDSCLRCRCRACHRRCSRSAGADAAARGRQELVLDDGHATRLGDNERVEGEHRQRNEPEHEQLGDPRPHGPDGPDAVHGHLLAHSTVGGLRVVLPEVRLDEMQQQDADTQQHDDDDCALSCAELSTLEWMTHADVPNKPISTTAVSAAIMLSPRLEDTVSLCPCPLTF